MRAAVEFIPLKAGRAWAFHVREAPEFPFTWHAHDYYELTVITAGRGRRFVGDHVAPYEPGDVALFGPRLPHTYAATAADGPHEACVAQFPAAWVERLTEGPEFGAVRAMLAQSARGVTGTAPVLAAARRLAELDGARQTVALLDLLTELAEDPSLAPLASTASSRSISTASADALSAVIGHLDTHYAEPLSRNDIAAAVGMSPSSVSRLMRRQMGTTLTEYLTEVRVGAASRALTGTDRPIADIAHACGFANLANFNRRFRRSRHLTPREYRRAFG
ncbi:helix-turn-helix domain-containing protein [Labedaea rhizosphaerae]|uniref:AraC family transcriptional regulator n=1 Tax=Labedaea rhizosphaerae TaxID=598644 RepID=A0A4R6S699_LABRH|nr:AraC family transcriptional regulator [Labedaea rhizosphaerae]TDP94834.1 AraC family transcriptional regulator [Labedaea rhizosphaerae]